ncbi:MAG: porin family protein [Bacteroidota bacterium]
MKARFILIFIFLCSTLFVNAQYFNAGIKLGVVGSQVDGDTYGGYDKLGLDIGLFVNYQLSMRTALQLEMEYIQKGSSHTPNVEKGDYIEYKMQINYLQLPVLFQYKLSQNFSAEMGPAFGLLLSNYEEYNQWEIQSNPFRKFAFSWVTGINYAINDNWNANFRLDYSLMGIRQKPAPGDRWIFFQYGQFNNALVISIHYLINYAKAK